MEKSTKFRLGVAAAALAGAAFGGVALGPVFAGAQEPSDSTTTTTPDSGSTNDSTTPPADGTAPADCQGMGGPGGGFRGGFGGPANLDVAADAIGISADDLRSALQDGQTIAEVAEANGVDTQTVIDALVADAKDHLDQAVTDGRITQDQADERAADLEDHVTDLLNGELPAGGPMGGHGPWRERPDAGSTDSGDS